MKIRINLRFPTIFFSIIPTEECIFSRRNGFVGKNILGHNILITKRIKLYSDKKTKSKQIKGYKYLIP